MEHGNCFHLIIAKEPQYCGTGKVLDQENGGAHDHEDDHVHHEGHRQRHLGQAHKHVGGQQSLVEDLTASKLDTKGSGLKKAEVRSHRPELC